MKLVKSFSISLDDDETDDLRRLVQQPSHTNYYESDITDYIELLLQHAYCRGYESGGQNSNEDL